MQRMRVDLPAPLGPMMARKSSLSTSKSIPFSIYGPLAVYLTVRFLTDKTDINKFSDVPCRKYYNDKAEIIKYF